MPARHHKRVDEAGHGASEKNRKRKVVVRRHQVSCVPEIPSNNHLLKLMFFPFLSVFSIRLSAAAIVDVRDCVVPAPGCECA